MGTDVIALTLIAAGIVTMILAAKDPGSRKLVAAVLSTAAIVMVAFHGDRSGTAFTSSSTSTLLRSSGGLGAASNSATGRVFSGAPVRTFDLPIVEFRAGTRQKKKVPQKAPRGECTGDKPVYILQSPGSD